MWPGLRILLISRSQIGAAALVYSSFLGRGGEDHADDGDIAVDSSGNIYVLGRTNSSDFPVTPGAHKTVLVGPSDAVVAKIDPSKAGELSLVWSTFLGGSGGEDGTGIAVDNSGNVYVSGVTNSGDFPTTVNAFSSTYSGGGSDAFVTKLNSSGSALLYSTYFGAAGYPRLFLDDHATIYLVGNTSSGFRATPGAYQTIIRGPQDTFVAKIDPSQTGSQSLVWFTYLGGTGVEDPEIGRGVVDSKGNVYITGGTTSTDFPIVNSLPGYETKRAGYDAYVAVLNSTGSSLLFSTYFGGNGDDEGVGIALDSLGNIYISGKTSSTDLFTSFGAFQLNYGGDELDVFLLKIGPDTLTSFGSNVSVSPAIGSTLTFANVTSSGYTTETANSNGPTPPTGFSLGDPATYYDITTTAAFTGSVTVCIAYDPAKFVDVANLRLFHFENSAWTDVTTTNDTTTNTICGQVSSFSNFAIGEPVLSPARVWIGLKNSDDVGIKFDLLAELYQSGSLVGSGQLNSVPGGSNGFNNAKLDAVPLGLFTSDFLVGSNLSIKLYVRNAYAGSGKNSSTARLWYNDAAANSRFAATVGGVKRNYYLLNGFALANGPGPGPKKTIDVATGAKCSAFKPFGTWSVTP
jgi:hypothetical protein